MLRAIGRALMSALSGLWKNTLGVVNWCEQLLRWPFSVIVGNGGRAMPTPGYKPDVSSTQLLEEFDEARARRAAVHTLDRDGVDTVLSYTRTTPAGRATFDLGPVKEDLRTALLDMSDLELDALGRAGLSAIRKFVDGKPHGVFGVRAFTPGQPIKAVVPERTEPKTVQERMLWRVRARAEKAGLQFQMPR
ncbi:hypothetical protein QO002_001107 [Pararhizobium capsulatum DSM 1112]|uniref:Uncharacterized protein n=1 Tax=Pararhizobium capsulatum DSM 1112 TaxID=1121113 RepID=A0ABU0BMK9_9HYPH|nr:hypothetical protein [Pararhizobium capsulatum]MDQ0318969.1 hypothetical protein [Pararhizobium capsulatum DSM 1112]